MTELDNKLKEYADLNCFIHKLKTIMEEEKIMTWLCTPNNAFDNKTPMKMIMAGDVEKLNRMVYEIGEGAFL
jgi:hypothetical protein